MGAPSRFLTAAALLLCTVSVLLAARANARPREAAHGGSHTNIYVVTPRGKHLTRLTDNRESDEDRLAYDPSWSPDGRRLVFTEVPCHSCRSEIHVMPARPVRGRWLGKPIGFGFHPRWSPDGKRIVFVGDTGGIYVVKPDGTGRRLVYKGGLANDGPSWSPDGKRIVFTQQETATSWRLYVVNVDGTRLRRIPTGALPAVNPAWSPDGRKIAFAGQRAVWQIYTVGLRGEGRRRLSNGRASDSFPSWSPDGRRLAFVRQERNGTAIFVMNANGRGIRRLTPRWMTAVQPAWSPRKAMIAFAGDRKG